MSNLFDRPSFVSEKQFEVITQVAFAVALSADSAKFQHKLLEKTKHLPAFNFIRDPTSHADVIAKNSGSVSSLSLAQRVEINRLYTNFLTSYLHNKAYYMSLKKSAVATSQTTRQYMADVDDSVISEGTGFERQEAQPLVRIESEQVGRKRARTPTDDDE
eukprot:GILI01020871.1.p1 GENE.GILI01020871.1~~GILI01020871.1.p1  ORF type:complete len:160 (-),score=7.51 GILI01020871.1:24-503(-)